MRDTHTKIKVSPLTGKKKKKNIFFVIPEMPSKTFVMVFKKIPDHFNLIRTTSARLGQGSVRARHSDAGAVQGGREETVANVLHSGIMKLFI